MGVVYKADDTKLRRAVALKFLTPDKTRDEQAKKRFMHEAQAASALDHPNIAVVHEIDETDDGSSFICMAYYPGQTLKEKIEAGPLPLDEVIDITLQITNGLQRAHEAGIVHRDIKPANIILTERGEVKIVDFGIAKLVNQTKTTDRGSKAGTALYMSPEQITGSPVDQRSDLFSVGVVLYEMVTGKRPFTGEHEPALFYSILNVEPTPPSELRSAVPALLESIVLKLLQKEPANRYEHAIELRADLMRVVGKEPQEQRKRKPFEFIKVRQPIVALISFALLVIVGVMYFVGPLSKTDRLARTSVSEKLTLAVLYFENQTNDRELDWLSKGIADMLIADLSRSQYLHLISMDRLYNIFQIVAEGTTDQNERSRALEIANRARAQIVITGSFLKSGEAIRIVAQVYDLRSDRLLPTPKIEGKGIASVFEMVDELSASIKLALEIKATGEEGAAEGIRRTKTRSVDAYKYFILGQDAARSSLYEDAIANVRKAIALDSTFAHAYRLLGYVYDAIGEEELGEEVLATALRLSHDLPRVDQLAIRLQYAKLKRDRATDIEIIKQLSMLEPFDPYWHVQLGWYYYAHKHSYEQSVGEYRRAIEIDSVSYAFTYWYLGLTYVRWGKREEAIDALRRYVSLRPNDHRAHDGLGYVYFLTGEYEKAREEFQTALQLRSNYVLTLGHLGDLYLTLGRNSEALSFYRRYLTSAPGKGKKEEGYFNLAHYYLENNQADKSIEEVRRALSSVPATLDAHWILGCAFVQKGLLDSADSVATEMEQILKREQSDYTIEYLYNLRGRIHMGSGDYASAVREFKQALSIGQREQDQFRHDLAEAYSRMGDFENALATFREVFDFNPNYPKSHIALAELYERQQKPREAIEHYEKFLQIWKNAEKHHPLMRQAMDRLSTLRQEP